MGKVDTLTVSMITKYKYEDLTTSLSGDIYGSTLNQERSLLTISALNDILIRDITKEFNTAHVEDYYRLDFNKNKGGKQC